MPTSAVRLAVGSLTPGRRNASAIAEVRFATPSPFLSELERLYSTAIAEELTELIVEEIARSQMHKVERPTPHGCHDWS